MVRVHRRAGRVPRRRRRDRRPRPLPRCREADGEATRRPVRPRVDAAGAESRPVPSVSRHGGMGRGAHNVTACRHVTPRRHFCAWAGRNIVAEGDVQGVRAEGDTALGKTTIGRAQGCELLKQSVIRFAPGRSRSRCDEARDDVTYVLRVRTMSSSYPCSFPDCRRRASRPPPRTRPPRPSGARRRWSSTARPIRSKPGGASHLAERQTVVSLRERAKERADAKRTFPHPRERGSRLSRGDSVRRYC